MAPRAPAAQTPAVTGTLTVRYAQPAPLHTELVFSARVESTEGRKVLVKGDVTNGDEVCAYLEAVMIRPR